MIKIRLTDPANIKCFSGLLHTKDLLREYSIDITNSSDYDYEFVHTDEFLRNVGLSNDDIYRYNEGRTEH